MMYSIQLFNESFNRPFGEQFWRDYANMYNTLIASDHLAVPRTADEMREEITNDVTKNPSAYRAVIFRDGDVYGYIRSYGFNMDHPKKRVVFEFDALCDRFDDELLEVIREQALAIMRLRDAERLVYKTGDAKIHDAYARLGGECIAECIYFTLDMTEADTQSMEAAMEQASASGEYHLRFFTRLPEELIEEQAARMTDSLGDMPGYNEAECVDPNDLRRRQDDPDANTRIYRYLAFDKNERIVGHTNVGIDMRSPQIAYQHITGVDRAHRGKGLSLWMKSAMFFRLREDFPQLERISTDTLRGNLYMQRVNAVMGFKPMKEAKEYKLLRSVLEEAVVA